MTEREELINIIKSCNNPKYSIWPQAVVYPDMVADELIKAGYVKRLANGFDNDGNPIHYSYSGGSTESKPDRDWEKEFDEKYGRFCQTPQKSEFDKIMFFKRHEEQKQFIRTLLGGGS